MKVIIKGKLYNTETAKEIAYWLNSYHFGDLQFCSETLYRKKNGEYFLHGQGGAMSIYARSIGDNNWSGGEHIEPLSYDAAKDWAEKKLNAEEYVKIFGEIEEIEEDNTKTKITLSLPQSKIDLIKKEMSKRNITASDYIIKAIEYSYGRF